MRIPVLVLAAAVLCASPARAEKSAPAALALPYTLPAPGKSEGDGSMLHACPSPPAKAPRDMLFQSVYSRDDPHRAQVDPAAYRKYRDATEKLRLFENRLLQMSNAWLRTGDGDIAACVLDWLHGWARRGAMLGRANAAGVAVRQWTLASLSSAFAQIRHAELPGREDRRRAVAEWLLECAARVMADYPADSTRGSKRNNHLYWAAWAVTITGIATDEKALYDWGIMRTRQVLYAGFDPDGTLPLEMKRGKKALHYHIFAATPLVMVAEAGMRNGDNLYAENGGILHTFVKRVIKGIDDSSYFMDKSGVEQESASTLHPGHLAWMEPYQSRFPSAHVKARLDPLRPLILRRTGGNITYLYRKK